MISPRWPPPRHLTERDDGFPLPRTAGLVRAADADGPALRAVRAALAAAGVTDVRESAADPGTDVTVWVSGGEPVLARLGVTAAPEGPEAYVLAAGRHDGRAHIVLAGADGAGTFYAAGTLAGLLAGGRMPGVVVRDRPAMRYRGSIEGFYGTPWSHADRLDHLDYLGAHRMNAYQYAPKDDPYHRDRWREPYPPDRLTRLGELISRARENHVEFTFALSPGLSMRYTSAADLDALLAKFAALYDLGCRSFTVPFDDIDHRVWHDPADREFGDGPAGAGAAQAHVLNAVAEWARARGDVRPPQLVPTEYHDLADTPYKRALRERLDPDVVVHWTGVDVIPETITVEQAERARAVFGHPILIWDNHPVNDYIPGRLPLGAYTGREPGLSGQVAGVLSNPANQAAVSKVALFSVAAFGWHDAGFDPERARSAALAERAGGDERTTAALRAFADVSTYDGRLHLEQAPALAAAVAAFRRGDAEPLRRAVRALAEAPEAIRAGVVDPAFAAEAAAWLAATGLWAAAMEAAIDMLTLPPAPAWAARRRLDALVARANDVRDTREPHSETAPKIGDGVVDAFVDAARASFDHSVGVHRPRPYAIASLRPYRAHALGRMTDGDEETWFWSDVPPAAGDWVGVDLGGPRPIGEAAVLMDRPGHLRAGALECSADGLTWTVLATGATPEVRATAPAGTTARYVRYRATAGNDGHRCAVREFRVAVPAPDGLSVTGGPPGDLAAVLDGSLETAYTATASPADGDALLVEAAAARPVSRVRVLGAAGSAEVSVRADGTWRHIGHVSAGYADLDAGGAPADAVRLTWANGSEPPSINAIVLDPAG